MRRARGFTLLEVLVAVAILGLGLATILSAQASAFASAAHARNIGLANGLLRCKMTEIEEHLYRDGFQETDETGAGPCCDGDDNPTVRCAWRIERPQFPEAKFGDLDLQAGLNLSGPSGPGASGGANPLGALGLLAGAPGGANPLAGASSMTDVAKTLADANNTALAGANGAAPGQTGQPGQPGQDGAGAGMGGLASMAMSIVYPSLKLLFEASARRIVVTVTYRQGKKEYSTDLIQWFAVPQKPLASDADTPESIGSSTPSSNKPPPGGKGKGKGN
jgi:general secretion pathway protein I